MQYSILFVGKQRPCLFSYNYRLKKRSASKREFTFSMSVHSLSMCPLSFVYEWGA